MTDPAQELEAHLTHFEGFVGHPYRCAAGKLTIGYGHRIAAPIPDITEAQALALLREDIAKYTKDALRLSPSLATAAPRRRNAIVDFCFNCGPDAYEHSTLRQMVNVGRWEDAAAQMARWVYVTDPVTKVKHPSAWQTNRRAVTAQWLREG